MDTSTKGTGASMVPLDSVRKPSGRDDPLYVPPAPRPQPAEAPQPSGPRRFKIVDVSTREVLTEGADARAAIDVLSDVRSIVDVHVYVWQPTAEEWRLLTFHERRLLWDLREQARPAADVLG